MAREIARTTAFKRDYKREKRGPRRKYLDELLRKILVLLVEDSPLPAACREHALTGNWSGFRDCHLKPDLVLIFARTDPAMLVLVRLGSRSELFG